MWMETRPVDWHSLRLPAGTRPLLPRVAGLAAASVVLALALAAAVHWLIWQPQTWSGWRPLLSEHAAGAIVLTAFVAAALQAWQRARLALLHLPATPLARTVAAAAVVLALTAATLGVAFALLLPA